MAVAAFAVVPASTALAATVEYTVEDLGAFAGGSASYATGVNASGEVTGFADRSSVTSAVRWSGGTMTDLGHLGCGGRGEAIAGDGTVVGWSNVSCAEIDKHGFKSTPGGLEDIGSLGAVPTLALGVNDAGQIVGSSVDANGNGRAFRTGPGGVGMQSIDSLAPVKPAGATAQSAHGINAAGHVVGSAFFFDSGCGSHNPPFLFLDDSRLQELRAPDGSCGGGVAHAVNDSDVSAGYLSYSAGTHAMRWNGTVAEDIGKLLAFNQSYAYGINSAGTVVGSATQCNICVPKAWVYSDSGGMKVLNDVIDPSLGWDLQHARDVNDAGTIVGWGAHNGVFRAFKLTPVPRTVLTSIAVTPGTASVAAGDSQQFTATGTYSDGSSADLTSSVQWASSASSIATVTTSGLTTGLAAGTATISASLGSVTGTATLEVTPAVLRSVSVTPAEVTLRKGDRQQFTATGLYSDGSTANLTASVAWASSNPTAVNISTTGLAHAQKVGASNVTATLGTTSGSATVVVTAKK